MVVRVRTIYDPAYAAPPVWTTPTHESPFRARGIIFQRDLAHAERTVPGGAEAVLNGAANPHLAAYFRQSFSAHRWYDAAAITLLTHVAARLRGLSLSQYTREGVPAYVDAAFSGVSGIVLRSLSLEAIATWLPKASSWFNDFGTIETRATGAHLVRATRTSLPDFMVLPWAIAGIEFAELALNRCGAKETRVYPLAVEGDGERDGHRLNRVSFEIAWRE
jgi:hypothetical protein